MKNTYNITKTPEKSISSTPFMNEFIKGLAQPNIIGIESQTTSTLMTLQQKIQDAVLSEPRSLINSLTKVQDNFSSSKKRKIMGLPNYENQKVDLIHKFDLGELETVHEKSDANK